MNASFLMFYFFFCNFHLVIFLSFLSSAEISLSVHSVFSFKSLNTLITGTLIFLSANFNVYVMLRSISVESPFFPRVSHFSVFPHVMEFCKLSTRHCG